MRRIIISLLTVLMLSLLVSPAYADNYTIGPNDTKTVTLTGLGQTHKVKLTLKESGYLNMTFRFHEAVVGTGGYRPDQVEIKVKIYDDNNNMLVDYWECNRKEEEYKSTEGYYRAGVYTMELWRDDDFYSGKSRKVTITTEFTSSKESFPETNKKNNDAQSKANKISLNKEYKGTRSSWDYYDYYSFELKDDYTVPHFNLNWFGSDRGYLYLYDKSGNELGDWYVTQSDSWDANTELKKGTYYVRIGNNNYNNGGLGDYSFSVGKSYQGWMQNKYWYENGVRQGTNSDPKCVIGDGTCRGREIYDPDSNGWYWLDAVFEGAKATNKEVWMPYIYQDEDPSKLPYLDPNDNDTVDKQVIHAIKNRTGKWVRYDSDGKMYKEWYEVSYYSDLYPSQRGNKYYYDPITGLMAKGGTFIGRDWYYFDPVTGVLQQ